MSERKTPPPVPEDEDDRLTSRQATVEEIPSASSPKSWAEKLQGQRLSFGQQLIGWCVFLIVVLTVFGAFRESPLISTAIDTMKLITTTALGFVFGRSIGPSDS